MAFIFLASFSSTILTALTCVILGAGLLVLLITLFNPGVRYTISSPSSEDNTSPEFSGALEALTDAKLTCPTGMVVLTNGSAFYEAELAEIGAAQRSVCLEAYIFYAGEIAKRYVDTMAARAKAGVRVNVVLDAVGSMKTSEQFFNEFKAAGGKLSWYNSARWYKLPHYDNRTHRELLVVDGKTGFIGGAGIADEWYKGSRGRPRWRDTMIKVTGPAVANLQAAFAENWLESSGEILLGEDYFPELEKPKDRGNVLVVGSSPTSGGSTRARILFQLLIASAKKTIHVNTPYFLPDESFSRELARAVQERGVEVKVIVPGQRSDIWLTRKSSRRKYGALLKAGVKIFEYQPSMIHAKILLIDGLWAVVGSTNCDYRSFGLNDEVNLAAQDPNLVQRLSEDFATDLEHSREITYEEWRHRTLFERAPEVFGWVLERQQ